VWRKLKIIFAQRNFYRFLELHLHLLYELCELLACVLLLVMIHKSQQGNGLFNVGGISQQHEINIRPCSRLISVSPVCSPDHLNLSQQLFLSAEAGLHPLVVAAVQLVELGERQLLLTDGSVLGERRQEGGGHVKCHGLDFPLQGLPLLLHLLQLSELRAQHVHHLRRNKDGKS